MNRKTLVDYYERKLRLTRLDKVFWPAWGGTKADLIHYFAAVGPVLSAHLNGRPLVLTRYPDGIEAASFYQKDCPDHAPDWVKTWPYRAENGRILQFVTGGDPALPVWLANLGTIEIHPWLSKIDHPQKPDQLVFDLDPADPAGFDQAREVAMMLKTVLDQVDLYGYPKTSGATGIHIYVPVEPVHRYETVRHCVLGVARVLRDLRPDLITLNRRVEERSGRVYIDYLQNVRGKTIVGPYIPRPLPQAPVSTPVSWSELQTVQPTDWTVRNIPQRLDRMGDLFEPVRTQLQPLDSLITLFGKRA